MHLQSIVLIFPPLIATLACAVSIPQSKFKHVSKARISRDVDHSRVSSPNQTIGDYFDSLLSEDQSALSERTIHRTPAFTEAIWTDGTTNFNISMSRCVTMSDKAGLYTAKIGNLPNATVQDIVDDLQTRGGSEAANRVEYASRVQENAELAINAANDLLRTLVADYTPITTTDESNTHGELRHLLAVAEMVVVIINSSLITEILVAFFTGIMGRAFGEVYNNGAAIYAVTIFALQMSDGIHKIAAGRQMNFVAATIANIFLAWVRDSMRVFAGEFLPDGKPGFLPSVAYDKLIYGSSNQTAKGTFRDGSTWPLAQDVIENALGALNLVDQPRGRYRAASGFRPEGTCPVPRI